ncbi:MAG: sulfatase-like hydrolase/transferase [Nitrospiraceae bacterium]|nr:sulfatase-like hydrolase/transferase [Nitrospiraceae bacterium]
MNRRDFFRRALSGAAAGSVMGSSFPVAIAEAKGAPSASDEAPAVFVKLWEQDMPPLVELETRAVYFNSKESLDLLGEGWDGAHGDIFWKREMWVWASRHTAEVWLTVLAPRDLELRLELRPRPFKALPAQRCEFIWGEERLGSVEFKKEDGHAVREVRLRVPASCQRVGRNRLIIASRYAASPSSFEGEGDDPRFAAIALKALEIREIGKASVTPRLSFEDGQVIQNRYARWRIPFEVPSTGKTVFETRLRGRGQVVLRQDTLEGTQETVLRQAQSDGSEKLVADLSPWHGKRVEILLEGTGTGAEEVTWIEPALLAPGGQQSPSDLGEPTAQQALRTPKARHVVLVVLDALRADALGCYGYYRDTSPFLDALSRRSVLYENARSAYTYTYPSVTSLLTSLHAFQHGVHHRRNDRLQNETLLVQHWLQSQGVGTGCVSQNPFLSEGRGLGRHFALFQGFFDGESQTAKGCAAVTDAALEMASQLRRDPSFLYVHYLPPHGPYEMAGEFAYSFSSVSRDDVDTRSCWAKSVLGNGRAATMRQIAKIRAAYDENVRKADALLEDLFSGLKRAGFGSETVVIITSDHGEEFLEHGEAEHGGTPFETQCHIPLVVTTVSEEGLGKGVRCMNRVGTVDLAPTICEILGVPHQPHAMGRSIFSASPTAFEPSFSQGPDPLDRDVGKRREAYVWDRYKLLAALPPVEGSLSEANRWARVYDLSRDPQERFDLAPFLPVLSNCLQSQARAWKVRQQAAISPDDLKGADATRSDVTDPAVEEALAALGYLSGN